jgi:drug/metabolite transporter (DMT)-like permease
VAAKLAAPGMSLVMQGGLRCLIALVLLVGWARLCGTPLFDRDGSLWPGLLAGGLFSAEFLFIFAGLNYTGASRMVVFINLTPCLTALGLHAFVTSERLEASKWAGIALAFGGIAVAFWDGFASDRSSCWETPSG